MPYYHNSEHTKIVCKDCDRNLSLITITPAPIGKICRIVFECRSCGYKTTFSAKSAELSREIKTK